MMKNIKILSLLILLMSIVSIPAPAQEEEVSDEPVYVDFTFKYLKQTDDSYRLTATLMAEAEEGYFALEGLPVEFSYLTDSSNFVLGTMNTDGEGNAIFVIPPGTPIYKDADGYMNFYAEFTGDDVYDFAYGEFMVKDLFINMETEIIDSVKTVMISVYYIDGEGQQALLNEDDMFLFVKGLYSKLQIADGWLEEGKCIIELSEDIPGDKDGNITLIAGYIEHSDFGDVEKSKILNWGVIPQYVTDAGGKLWTNVAPTWMIVLLIILLTGVWGHYVYAMWQLGRIKKYSEE